METSQSTQQFEEPIMSNDHLQPLHLQDASHVNFTRQHDTNTDSTSLGANHSPVDSDPVSAPSIIQAVLSSPDQIIAMISNYSTSFNVVSISIILPILQSRSLYYDQATVQNTSLCASALIAGMILGQLGGGALGDLIGRRNAIMIVMLFQVFGSLGGAFWIGDYGYDNNNNDGGDGDDGNFEGFANSWNVFEQLAAWRFLIGVGCGGVYPLAASLSSESQSQSQSSYTSGQNPTATIQQNVQKLKMLAATFSTQGIGFVSVPIVAIITLLICGENGLDFVWRFMVAFGALPGIILMVIRFREFQTQRLAARRRQEQEEEQQQAQSINDIDILEGSDVVDASGQHATANGNNMDPEHANDTSIATQILTPKPNLWNAIKTEEQLLLKLIGTAGTWFLFDIVFYGNTLFQPVVIKTAFGYDDYDEDDGNGANDQNEFSSLVKNIRDSMILSTIALPGYFVSIALIGRRMCWKFHQTPRFIQIQGFTFMAILYSTIAYSWDTLTQHHSLLVLLYGGTFFFSNYGPNTTTFMLPSITFSPQCRSTLNGIAAASGKAGALVGSLLFDPLSNKYGDAFVMFLCALTSVLAGVITAICCRPFHINVRDSSSSSSSGSVQAG